MSRARSRCQPAVNPAADSSLIYTLFKSTLAADLLGVPWQASVTCALTGKLSFDENAISGKDGQEVFSERYAIPLISNQISLLNLCSVLSGTTATAGR